jgi:hypothetical protein
MSFHRRDTSNLKEESGWDYTPNHAAWTGQVRALRAFTRRGDDTVWRIDAEAASSSRLSRPTTRDHVSNGRRGGHHLDVRVAKSIHQIDDVGRRQQGKSADVIALDPDNNGALRCRITATGGPRPSTLYGPIV